MFSNCQTDDSDVRSKLPEAEDVIDQRVEAAASAGIKLSDADIRSIRTAFEKAADLRRMANQAMSRSSDPMNKGSAFPMGVGFTRMTKRKEQRLDASVRRAGEACDAFKRADQAEQHAEALLSGKGTEADKANAIATTARLQRELVVRLLSSHKGQKISTFTIERVNKDRDGYPCSYTFSGDGIVKGVTDKVDVVRTFFGGDKVAFRALVDLVKSEQLGTRD